MGRVLRRRPHIILSADDFDLDDVIKIFDITKDLKSRYYSGERYVNILNKKIIGLIFQKPSTRTRVSFEVAIRQLGGESIYMSWNELQLGRGEPIKDTARVLERYLDGIIARVYKHEDLVEFSRYISIPLINGLSDREHPVQALSDYYTIYERFGRLKGLKIAFVGDGSDNVSNSLLILGAKLGVEYWIATAPGYEPPKDLLDLAFKYVEKTGAKIVVTHDVEKAVSEADVVYTDVWVSMGQEHEREKRLKDLADYQVNTKIMSLAKKNAVFMHCLPAKRGEEVTDEVIEGEHSIVWDQAENRLHVQKGLLAYLYR
ncbi:MAG: ornithine carbamoyltransferase [Desulfurococcales archaeon]|jgi:ornithine carbamoyltransferase|nr:ornithine carbamoyltransferase [Desulfurococcales archaeon]MCC6062497.1 ornithine carbamoyltransferase [Desulfurococcales archaeon]